MPRRSDVYHGLEFPLKLINPVALPIIAANVVKAPLAGVGIVGSN